MILLLSSDGDISTDFIIQWLNYYNYPYLRLSPQDFLEKNLLIDPLLKRFIFNGSCFLFSEISVVWYRKFGYYTSSNHYKKVTNEFGENVAKQLKLELNNITDYFVSHLSKAFFIGSRIKGNTNKLIELQIAKEVGLDVPYTIVTSDINIISNLLNNGKKLISKSVYNAFSFIQNDIGYTSYTSEINLNFINKLPTNIFPSLVQEKVEKEYEIRVFYFLGKFYSMAILSQNNKQTELDYRKYDLKKPNRFIPYKLSDKLKNKISLFMKKLNLNIGSLDFIKSTNGKIYFLEVNFMGQFGMVDFPCNYGIHKDIAEFLINFDKKDYEIY